MAALGIPVCSKNCKIIFFVKAPLPGNVKTRLAIDIGSDNAVLLYKAFVNDILETLKASGLDFIIFFTPTDSLDCIKSFIGNNYIFYAQDGNNLGEKMANAFKKVFDAEAEMAILIGSDTIDITSSDLKTAFETLCNFDMVLGPAEDGGYYLIGFKKSVFKKSYFNNVRWSTQFALEDTLKNVKDSCSFMLLDKKRDVDTFTDLKFVFRLVKEKHICLNTISVIENKQIL